MPISRFINELDTLIEEFRSNEPTRATAFDELRLAVARLNEIRRQVDLAYEKLGPIITMAEMDVIHNRIDFSESERILNNQFLVHEECLTGHPGIDGEHRQLVSIGNRVYALARDSNPTADQVHAALDEFDAHVRAHFRTEEKLMADWDFPKAQGHKAIHDRMIDYIGEMLAICREQPLAVAIKMEKFLGSWFVWHMQRDDMELARYGLALGN